MKNWLVPVRKFLPAVFKQSPDGLWLSKQEFLHAMRPQPALPPCHDIPLGYQYAWDGKEWQEYLLAYGPDWPKSLLTIVGARGGKTACQLGYELGVYGGEIDDVAPTVIVMDKKGELCMIAGRARYELGDVCIRLDPYGIIPDSPWVINGRWNLLDGITPAHNDFEIQLFNRAAGLIIESGSDPHWWSRGQQLVGCLLGNACDDSNQEPAELPYLMEILRLPASEFKAYMERLTESPIPLVRNFAGPFCDESNEVRSIVSTVVGQLSFLNDQQICSILRGPSSFQTRDLKRGGLSLFFCLPDLVTATFPRFSRLLWASIVSSMYRMPYAPCLCIIDEASSSLDGASAKIFEDAFSLGSGYGLRIHLLFQSFAQLKAMFKGEADTIISGAGVKQFFAINDASTAAWIAERAGDTTMTIMNRSVSFNQNVGADGRETSGTSESYAPQYFKRPRWTAQQLYEFPSDQQILFFEGIGAPVIAARKPYWQSAWKERLDDNLLIPKARRAQV